MKLTQNEKDMLTNEYYKNDMRHMRKMCQRLFYKIGGICQMDHDDLFDIATMEFVNALESYDTSFGVAFDNYLMGNINRKYMTYIRDSLTDKRAHTETFINESGKKVKRKIQDIRLDAPINEDNNMCHIDILESNFDIMSEIEYEDYTQRITEFLDHISKKSRRIAILIMDGYKPHEIMNMLHIGLGAYNNAIKEFKSYKNVCILLGK